MGDTVENNDYKTQVPATDPNPVYRESDWLRKVPVSLVATQGDWSSSMLRSHLRSYHPIPIRIPHGFHHRNFHDSPSGSPGFFQQPFQSIGVLRRYHEPKVFRYKHVYPYPS